MKLQELSLSDLYGLKQSFKAQFDYHVKYKPGQEVEYHNYLCMINSEIIRRETEIIKDIFKVKETAATCGTCAYLDDCKRNAIILSGNTCDKYVPIEEVVDKGFIYVDLGDRKDFSVKTESQERKFYSDNLEIKNGEIHRIK